MWKTLLDVFFPKKCIQCKRLGNYLCDKCFSYIELGSTPICPKCNKHSIEGATHPACLSPYSIDGLVSAVVYHGVIKRLVYQFKYSPYLSDLKDEMGELMCESLNQNELFFQILKQNPLMTPVPLYRERSRTRGYNHAALLCSYVAQYFKQEYVSDLTNRVKNTKPQYRLNRSARFENLQNAFSLNYGHKTYIRGKTIVVVDDLATTCSTLNEIAKVLKRNGAKKVYGVVFAREEGYENGWNSSNS